MMPTRTLASNPASRLKRERVLIATRRRPNGGTSRVSHTWSSRLGSSDCSACTAYGTPTRCTNFGGEVRMRSKSTARGSGRLAGMVATGSHHGTPGAASLRFREVRAVLDLFHLAVLEVLL